MSLEVTRATAGMVLAELYVSDREGNDATGDGTKEKPFKTGLKALLTVGKEPFPTIYVDSQKENERWDVISKSQMKNIKKMWHREQMKSESREKKEVSCECAPANLSGGGTLDTVLMHCCILKTRQKII